MAFEAPIGVQTLEANGDLSLLQFRAVKAVGAQSVGPVAAITDIPVGVLQNKPNAAGKAASFTYLGVTKMEAGGAITGGAAITIDSVGRAIAATSSTNIWGVAYSAAGASGDIVSVQWGFAGVHA